MLYYCSYDVEYVNDVIFKSFGKLEFNKEIGYDKMCRLSYYVCLHNMVFLTNLQWCTLYYYNLCWTIQISLKSVKSNTLYKSNIKLIWFYKPSYIVLVLIYISLHILTFPRFDDFFFFMFFSKFLFVAKDDTWRDKIIKKKKKKQLKNSNIIF